VEFQPGEIYHVYNKGNNRVPIFFGKDNYLFFLKKMRSHLLNHCDILAWCLMPNHFHWIIQMKENYSQHNSDLEDKTNKASASKVGPLNRSIATLLSSYTRAINKAHNRSGSLFRSHTKAKNLTGNVNQSDQYLLTCFVYIHQNPLRAGLVKRLEDWEFSSYKDYTGERKGSLCNIRLAKSILNLPDTNEQFIQFSYQTIPEAYLGEIRA
jgi:REP element-mobilizing transposase RayT